MSTGQWQLPKVARILRCPAAHLANLHAWASAGGTSITQWISQPTLKTLKVPSTSRTGAKLSTYNAMIVPLRLFDFDGVAWYQVCSGWIDAVAHQSRLSEPRMVHAVWYRMGALAVSFG
jgi:hypothetical protein